MVHIIIPFKNKSVRLEGKNLMLLPFTIDYIKREIESDPRLEGAQIHTLGCIETRVRKMIESQYGITHIQLRWYEDRSHEGAVQNALEKIGVQPEDKIIMLQLTQPRRRHGLIGDAVEAIDGGKPVVSATRVLVDGRMVNREGRRYANQPEEVLLYDGQIYGGTMENYHNWWTLRHQSTVVVTDDMSVVDIDTPEDLLHHTIFIQ